MVRSYGSDLRQKEMIACCPCTPPAMFSEKNQRFNCMVPTEIAGLKKKKKKMKNMMTRNMSNRV